MDIIKNDRTLTIETLKIIHQAEKDPWLKQKIGENLIDLLNSPLSKF
jgi:hypothetical protein